MRIWIFISKRVYLNILLPCSRNASHRTFSIDLGVKHPLQRVYLQMIVYADLLEKYISHSDPSNHDIAHILSLNQDFVLLIRRVLSVNKYSY